MSFKNKIVIKLLLIYAYGIGLIIAGKISNPLLITMGAAMLLSAIVLTVKNIAIFSNPEKQRELETAVKDERLAFISTKSYAAAFWVSLSAEFLASCVLLYLNMTKYGIILYYVICFQTIVYLAAHMICRKKY